MDVELKQYLDSSFGQIDEKFGQLDARFGQIDARFEQLDARFEQLEARFEQLEARFAEARMEARADLEKTETKLLRAFHEWSRPYEIRVRSAVAIANSFDERVALLEERISELERRQNAA